METGSARSQQRLARQRFIEELRAAPPPSAFKLALYGAGAGVAAMVVHGLLYLLIFGVVGGLLARWKGQTVLVGYPWPLFPMFLSGLLTSSVFTAIQAVLYHFLCRVFPRAAGPAGGIGFTLALLLVLQVVSYVLWPVLVSGTLRAFGVLSGLATAVVVGAVIGQAELFERKPRSTPVAVNPTEP
jgi:hypothetical protein